MRNSLSKILVVFAIVLIFALGITPLVKAQDIAPTLEAPEGTSSATGSAVVVEDQSPKPDVTRPEEAQQKEEYLQLFKERQATTPTFSNFIAYFVQESVRSGIPANTVILILLLPLLATIIAFFRHVIGVPSAGLILPISLSITLLATGLWVGLTLLSTILLASIFARVILQRIRIMQLPKMAISMWVVSILVFMVLTEAGILGWLPVTQISIFPILLLIILSEQLVRIQMNSSGFQVNLTILITLILGWLGFLLLSWEGLRRLVLLYPELTLLIVPINLAIGRYFGLRLTEYLRFNSILRHGSK